MRLSALTLAFASPSTNVWVMVEKSCDPETYTGISWKRNFIALTIR